MKAYKLNLLSSESIRTQIQKEEINKIIQLQKGKQTKLNFELSSFSEPKRTSNSKRRNLSSFSIKERKIKQVSYYAKSQQSQSNKCKVGLSDQISYFSIKDHYEKVINSTEDWNLLSQLKSELNQSAYRYNLAKTSRSGNFFQKIQLKQINPKRQSQLLIKQPKIYFRQSKSKFMKAYLLQFI